MAAKGGKAKKEENAKENAVKQKQKSEQQEAEKWKEGAKSKDTSKEEKRLADLARKQEAARILAEEEKALSAKAPKPAAGAKPKVAAKSKAEKEKKVKAAESNAAPAGPGAIAAGGGLGAVPAGDEWPDKDAEPVPHLEATGIDAMLEALEVTNAKADKASVGAKAGAIEAHPERRFKAALEKYIEDELPVIRKEQPGLRLQQYKERLFIQFKKHPDNPFNQVTVAYNATQEDKVAAHKAQLADKERRLQQKDRA